MTIYVSGTSVPVSSWYDQVLPWMPGLDVPLALSQIQEAILDFCARSWVLNDFMPAISVVANQSTYAYAPPQGLQVTKRLQSWLSEQELSDKAPGDLSAIYGANWSTKTGAPTSITSLSPVTVRLVPIPAVAVPSGLIMRVVYQPLVSTTDVDTILWTHYGDDIAKGARALLYKMAKKPWGNAQLAAAADSAFEDAIAAARFQVQRGFGRARPRVRAHYF